MARGSLSESRALEWRRIVYSEKRPRGVYNEVQIELKINEIKKSVLGVFIQSGWFRCYFCVDPSEFPQGDFVYRPSFVGIQYPDQRRGVGLGWSGTGVVFKGPIPEYL